MEVVVFILIWIVFACGVGLWADSRGRSVVGFFCLSFLTSPILAGIVLLIMSDKNEEARKEKEQEEKLKQADLARKEEHEKQLESLRAITAAATGAKSQDEEGKTRTAAEEIERLHKLLKDGILNQEEFDAAKKRTLGLA